MKLARMVIVPFCLLFVSTVLVAVPENASAASEKDARLEKKVSVTVSPQKLGELLSYLSASTGVKMAASPELSERKLVVLVNDIPAGDLLDHVQTVLHLSRRAEGEAGKWQYELFEDAATKQEAQVKKNKLNNAIRDQMDHAAAALKLPEEQWKKQMETDPLLEPFIGDRNFRVAVHAYSVLNDKQRARLWDTRNFAILIADMPQNVGREILDLYDENRRVREQSENIKLTDKVTYVYFEVEEDPLAGRRLSFNIKGSNNNDMTFIFVPSPEGGTLCLLGNPDLFTLATEKDPVLGEVFRSVPKDLTGRLAEKRTVKFADQTGMAQALVDVFSTEKINLVSDFCTAKYSMTTMVDGWDLVKGDTIAELLEKVAGAFGCTWTMRDDTCLMWSKEWFEDRDVEIPASLVAKWRNVLQTNGQYGLTELMEIAALNRKQIRSMGFNGVPSPPEMSVTILALRFVSAMTPEQRKEASGMGGLSASRLSPAAKTALIDWIESPIGPEHKPSRMVASDADSVLIHILQPSGETWAFGAETPDGRTRMDTIRAR